MKTKSRKPTSNLAYKGSMFHIGLELNEELEQYCTDHSMSRSRIAREGIEMRLHKIDDDPYTAGYNKALKDVTEAIYGHAFYQSAFPSGQKYCEHLKGMVEELERK